MPLELFGDFGFAGGFDQTANPYQDAQVCLNWYPEVSPAQQTAKEVVALLGSPGLIQLAAAPGGGAPGNQAATWPQASTVTTLQVRGAWVLPGWQQALVVIANTCYLLTIGSDGNQNTPGTIVLTPVGTLSTSAGQVNIRDNDTGGFAIIVDGTYGYLYSLTGQPVATPFQALTTNSSNGVQLTGQVPLGIVIATTATLTDSDGYIPSGTSIVSIDYSAGTLTLSNAATGTDAVGDTLILTIAVWTQIEDPGFLGATTVSYIDGWWILNQPGTQTFYTNAQAYALNFNASYYDLKDAASDKLLGVIENKEELWLVGERTTEIWYNAGGATFPFQRLVGTLLQIGTTAVYSIARLASQGQEGLIWVGRSERGENIIVRIRGFMWEVVSTPAVSNALAKYTTTADAIGYTYEEGAHEFYVVSFPTADQTWVYDATLPPPLAWTQRLSYDPYAQRFHRHRSNCLINFAGMRIVGDYQNGALYQMTRAAYTDAGWPILARRRTPYIWDKENRERVFMASLQVDFAPGVGNASGMGVNPQATLRISRDYGTTYGVANTAPMGAIGQYTNRCMWRKLGFSRGAVAQIEVIDPVNRDIVGATLRASGA